MPVAAPLDLPDRVPARPRQGTHRPHGGTALSPCCPPRRPAHDRVDLAGVVPQLARVRTFLWEATTARSTRSCRRGVGGSGLVGAYHLDGRVAGRGPLAGGGTARFYAGQPDQDRFVDRHARRREDVVVTDQGQI